MSYAKAMKHWRNPRKHKMTVARRRGNWLIFGKPITHKLLGPPTNIFK